MAYVDKELIKKAIKFYRDGLPIEVIENLTRIPKLHLESILGEVELTKDELLARKESLEIFPSPSRRKSLREGPGEPKWNPRFLEALKTIFPLS